MAKSSRAWAGRFFSLGKLIAKVWRPSRQWMPWSAAAIGLALAAFFDTVRFGRSPDFILLGLASYEVLIGLTEPTTHHEPADRSQTTNCL